MSHPRESSVWPGRASLLLLLLWVVVIGFRPVINNDFWVHARLGEDVLATWQWPHVDSYSATAGGRPYIAFEWGAGVIFALVDRLGPLAGTLLRVLLFVPTIALLYLAVPRERRDFALAVPFLLLCTYVIAFRSSVRPHLFSLLFFSALLFALARWQRNPRWREILWLPASFALWVNLHGAFLLGLAVLGGVAGAMALSRLFPRLGAGPTPEWSRIWPLGVILLASALATLLNPYGVELLTYPITMTGENEFFREFITEWQSPFERALRVGRYLVFWGWLGLLVFLWTGLLGTLRRRTTTELGLALVLTWLSFRANRFIPYTAMVAFPILVSSWRDLLGPRPRRRPVLELVATGLLILTAVAHGYTMGKQVRPLGWGYGDTLPHQETAWMKKAGLGGVLFNDLMIDGDLVIHDLGPAVRPVMDARVDVYGEELYLEWRECRRSEASFIAYLDKYGVNLALLSRQALPLIKTLNRLPSWQLVFATDSRVVFRKRS